MIDIPSLHAFVDRHYNPTVPASIHHRLLLNSCMLSFVEMTRQPNLAAQEKPLLPCQFHPAVAAYERLRQELARIVF